jgi:hypothetical protein
MGLWGIDMQVTDKMIKAALEAWFGEPVTAPYDEHVDNMRFAIQAAIQAAWVSVDDELPRANVQVLTTDGYTYETSHRTQNDLFYGTYMVFRCATHWMPLPEFKEHS